MSNTFIYASCKDVNGKIEYLVAPSEEDIDTNDDNTNETEENNEEN